MWGVWGDCTQFVHGRSYMTIDLLCRDGARRVFTNQAGGGGGGRYVRGSTVPALIPFETLVAGVYIHACVVGWLLRFVLGVFVFVVAMTRLGLARRSENRRHHLLHRLDYIIYPPYFFCLGDMDELQ